MLCDMQLMKPIVEKKDSEDAAQEFIKRFSGFGVLLSHFQQVFEKGQFNHIDFFHEIAQEDLDASELYNRDPYHFSPKGNKFLAKTIYNHLVENLYFDSQNQKNPAARALIF